MGFLDDLFDPDQLQGSGGVLGRLFSASPQPNLSATAADVDPQDPTSGNSQPSVSAAAGNSQDTASTPDIGTRLGAGLQSWVQTPAGSPFAALANGIGGFNNAGNASFIGPPAPAPTQTPDFGSRLGAAFQSWAQTPVGNPFAALANGINGFNTGQTSGASATSTPARAQAQTPDNTSGANAPVQNPPIAPSLSLRGPARQLVVIRRSPQ